MLFTFGTYKHSQCEWLRRAGAHALLIFCLGLLMECTMAAMDEGDPCDVQRSAGVCKAQSQCADLEGKMKKLGLRERDVVSCGFNAFEELICCPGSAMPTPRTTTPTSIALPSTARAEARQINANLEHIDLLEILNKRRDQTLEPREPADSANLPMRPIFPQPTHAQLVTFNAEPAPQFHRFGTQRNIVRWPQKAPLARDANVDVISAVNNNLMNMGMDIVKAHLDKIDRGGNHGRSEPFRFPQPIQATTTTTTFRPHQLNPFEAFQFRPQSPDDYENVNDNHSFFVDQRPQETTPPSVGTPKPTTSTRLNNRPAVRACDTIDAGLQLGISSHIIGGTAVELGEYPHMVAIGYSSIGNEQGPYDFRCGGSLIDARYVLTAAHCLIYRDSQPQMVRMGVTNFTDESQMKDVVERKILTTSIHPQYRSSSKYNDIAILELESDVPFSTSVYPVCLYTEPDDPPAKLPLYVTGWGVINTKTRQASTILLKAKQEIVPLQRCNESYVAIGLNRHLIDGIKPTQMCTNDPLLQRDACQGDSGGPLNLVLDESSFKYRLVGVISAGFGCASATPSLYTRVSEYLDYIESIVWPTRR